MSPSKEQAKKAKEIHDLLTKEVMDNSYYNDEYNESCKTPDYQKIYEKLPGLIDGPEDLKLKHDGWSVGALVKLAINGGFNHQLNKTGSSKDNFLMIDALYEKTKEDKDFWGKEMPEEENNERGPNAWRESLERTPAASIVATRMAHEYFDFIKGEKVRGETLQTATELAAKFKHIPVFEKTVDEHCRPMDWGHKRDEETQAACDKLARIVAKAIVEKDFATATKPPSGPNHLELEHAIKRFLFIERNDNADLSRALESLQPKSPKPATQKPVSGPEME